MGEPSSPIFAAVFAYAAFSAASLAQPSTKAETTPFQSPVPAAYAVSAEPTPFFHSSEGMVVKFHDTGLARGGHLSVGLDEEVAALGGGLEGDGKAHALVAVGDNLRGVDAHHLAVHIHQGPAGVARVDGGVRLDIGHALFAVALHRPVQAGDNAPGKGAGEPLAAGVANGHHPLPDGELVRVPKLRRGKAVVVGLDDRQVRGAVHAHHHRVVLLAVIGGHGDQHALGVQHHMGVGDDIPVGSGDDARAGAVGLLPGAGDGDSHRGLHHPVVDLLGVQGVALRLLMDGEALLVGGHIHLGQFDFGLAGAAVLGLPRFLLGAVRLALAEGGELLPRQSGSTAASYPRVHRKGNEPHNGARRQGGGQPQEHLQPQAHFLPGRLGGGLGWALGRHGIPPHGLLSP